MNENGMTDHQTSSISGLWEVNHQQDVVDVDAAAQNPSSPKFQLRLLVKITTVFNDNSNLLLKIVCSNTHIYIKTQCLQTKWIKALLGVGKERIILLQKITKPNRVTREKLLSISSTLNGRIFRTNFLTKQNVTRETTFVRKIRTFNVDEIDT